MSALERIEAILAEIERLDRESRGQFREAEDREAFDIASRIERKMRQKFIEDSSREGANDRAAQS